MENTYEKELDLLYRLVIVRGLKPDSKSFTNSIVKYKALKIEELMTELEIQQNSIITLHDNTNKPCGGE